MAVSSDGGNSGTAKERIKQLLRENEKPFTTATEVADELDISRQGAHAHLSELAEAGEIERRKVGAKAVVWWLAD